jgi:aerobic carbon-monoxide dehydrogenase medium subunit
MRFEYLEPKSIEEATVLLSKYKYKAKIIAGGTDVMLQARNKAIKPDYLVDITNIPGLDYINLDDQKGLKIGSLTTVRALETSAELQKKYPIIAQAAGQIGSIAIRNVATLGGNLCNALPSAETAQVMVALSAEARVIGPGGERTISFDDFFTGVGKTALKQDEILLEVTVPRPQPNTKGVYIKHSPRGTIDLAVINVTVVLTMEPDHKTCKEARIVLGAVAPTPLRARKAEDILTGKVISDELIIKAAHLASDEANPRAGSIRGSPEYKKEMVKVLITRAIKQIMTVKA